jgi:hypothetical protein
MSATLPRCAARLLAPATAALAASALACTGEGNTGRSAPDASLVEAVPWLDGVLPAIDDAGNAVIPATPVYPPIATGLPDPGSTSSSCAALAGVETSAWVETFEPDMPADPTRIGVAAAWTAFDDLTMYAFHVPGDVTWYPGLSGSYSAPFGLPAAPIGAPSCDGTPNKWSLHFSGGLFRYWGGGVSHVFSDPNGCVQDAGLCPPTPAPGAAVDSAGLPLTTADGGAYAQSHAFIDASAYDGIAFWARRGPESQNRLIVTVTDSFTSDRLARQNETYCRRLRACYTQCLSGAPCSPDDPTSATPIYRCFDPAAGPLPQNVAVDALLDLMYPRCGPSACTSRASYPDPDFDGKPCRPYTFPAADISREYCFDDGDPQPPDRDEQCLDGWASSVNLTTDWQFYTVAFSDMQQGGFGKRAPFFNLTAVDTIAFSVIVGWADVYVDNVTFYRRPR